MELPQAPFDRFRSYTRTVRFLSVNVSRKQPNVSKCCKRSTQCFQGLIACGCMRFGVSFPYEPEGREFESLRARHLTLDSKHFKQLRNCVLQQSR